MTFFNYLQNNLRWQFVQNPFGALVCPPTSKATLYGELDKLAEKYFPQNAKIDTLQTEFCLNKIALSAAKNRAMQLVQTTVHAFPVVRGKNARGTYRRNNRKMQPKLFIGQASRRNLGRSLRKIRSYSARKTIFSRSTATCTTTPLLRIVCDRKCY